jgi:hypothetical protein
MILNKKKWVLKYSREKIEKGAPPSASQKPGHFGSMRENKLYIFIFGTRCK